MPSQKELRWSQLKVGILALSALTALTILLFLMSGTTGGLFTHKLTLIAFFENANGLKVGAPVTLDGVTIGNVTSIRIVPRHEPAAVEVISKVGTKYIASLHTDSTVAINQAGVLGDAFLDISSVHATGPELVDYTVLKVSSKPSIQDVVASSQGSIQAVTQVVHKVDILMDSINNGKGTIGVLLHDPAMARKLAMTIEQVQELTAALNDGKGTLGKLIVDQSLYEQARSTVERLNSIVSRLDKGNGTAGKLLTDDALYNNAGKGSLGKLAKDPALAEKVQESVTRLNELLKGLDEGRGTLGQLVVNKDLYNNLDKTLNDTSQLITAIRKDPKTYLTIHVKVF
jgi:phospholipid/cholesterol/gamma-HCH transport system substrate-binding protein